MASFLITGTSRGIGLELVKQLADLPIDQVSRIFAVTRSRSDDLQSVISSFSGRIVNILITDLSDIAEVSQAAAMVDKHLNGKGLDVLVNNAGIMPSTPGSGKMQDLEAQQLMEAFKTNSVAPHVMISGFLPLLRKGMKKQIFSISTTLGSTMRAASYSWSNAHAYKISKAALSMVNQQYALDLAEEGFTVMLISPGWLKTDMGSQGVDLDIRTGVDAVKAIMLRATPAANGTFQNIHVAGWENVEGPNQYDGKQIEW